jgi:hypothetical protein
MKCNVIRHVRRLSLVKIPSSTTIQTPPTGRRRADHNQSPLLSIVVVVIRRENCHPAGADQFGGDGPGSPLPATELLQLRPTYTNRLPLQSRAGIC